MSTNIQQPLPANPLKSFAQLIQDSQESLDAFIKQSWKSHRNQFHAAGKGNMHREVYEQIVDLQIKLAEKQEELEWLDQKLNGNIPAS